MGERGRGNSQGDSTCKPGPYIARIVRWVKGGEILIKHVSLVHALNILFGGGGVLTMTQQVSRSILTKFRMEGACRLFP